jgi:hypothetical protein
MAAYQPVVWVCSTQWRRELNSKNANSMYGILVEKPLGKRPRKNMLGCEMD